MGTSQAHTAKEHEGSSARKKWTLRRTLVEVQRGGFAKTNLGSMSAFPIARDGRCPHREHTVQHVSPDESLLGTSVKEHHATKRREGVNPAVNRDLRGERGVVKEE